MLNLNQVYHGDCIDVMKSISDKSIDIIYRDITNQRIIDLEGH